MQTDDGGGTVNVISFGLARTYIDENGDHIPLDLQKSFGGSLNFASRNAHLKRSKKNIFYIWKSKKIKSK